MSTTKHARTTQLIASRDGYFAWELDNGGVRILVEAAGGRDFPPGHPMHARIAAATPNTVEALFDEAMGS
jgi:hypothetical protein